MPNLGISFIQEQREFMWMTHGGKYLQIFIFEGQTMKWPEAPAKLMWPCFQIHTGSHYIHTCIFVSATLIYTYGS